DGLITYEENGHVLPFPKFFLACNKNFAILIFYNKLISTRRGSDKGLSVFTRLRGFRRPVLELRDWIGVADPKRYLMRHIRQVEETYTCECGGIRSIFRHTVFRNEM